MKTYIKHIEKITALLILLFCFNFESKASVDPATIVKEFVGQIKLYENFYPISYAEKKFFENIKQIQEVNKICDKVQKDIEAEKKQKFIIKDFPENKTHQKNSYSQLI